MKKIIKITTPWKHSFLPNQIPENLKKEFHFEIDNFCNFCDVWLIWGGLPKNVRKESVFCAPENVFFMTDEVHDQKVFNSNFLRQFQTILTGRTDVDHGNILRIHEFNHWHIKKNFNEVFNQDRIIKERTISMVSSDLTILPGHKNRFAFINKMIGHFKDRIDVFGRGFNAIDDKWDALAPYKYSIAIENNVVNGYFTEKITECFLSHTLPVYYGAPDITEYFNSSGLCLIDIENYKNSINIIEELIETDPFAEKLDYIIENKIRYLSHLNVFSAFVNIINQRGCLHKFISKRKITIYNEYLFKSKSNIKKILYNEIKKIIK